MPRCAALFGLTLSLTVTSGVAAQAQEVTVALDHLRCVQAHAQAYLAQAADEIVIVLPACPIVPFEEAIAAAASDLEAAASNMIGERDDGSTGPAPNLIISMSRDALACVAALDLPDTPDPITLLLSSACDVR